MEVEVEVEVEERKQRKGRKGLPLCMLVVDCPRIKHFEDFVETSIREHPALAADHTHTLSLSLTHSLTQQKNSQAQEKGAAKKEQRRSALSPFKIIHNFSSLSRTAQF